MQICLFLFLCIGFIACSDESSQKSISDIAVGFAEPQDSTRTKVWWFHGETETTQAGITADLEAYKQAGVGGVVYYDQVHNKKTLDALIPFSPQWWNMLLYAGREAARLSLTFECHVSNGYVAGGPWVTPDMAMQRLTAVDTLIVGGRDIEVSLPAPATGYYSDVAVLAFPAGATWNSSRSCSPRVWSSTPEIDGVSLFESGKNLTRIQPLAKGESHYIYLDFGSVFTARSISYQVAPRGKATTSATNVPDRPGDTFVGTGYQVLPPLGQLEYSDDGKYYHKVCDLLPIYKAHSSWKQKTISFPAVSARYFRLNLHDWNTPDKLHLPMQIGDVELSSCAKIDRWEEKVGLFSEYIEGDCTPHYVPAEIIDKADVLNITHTLDSTGMLRWHAPAGRWIVMRFAHVPTGAKTKHGRPALMGLECDKMSSLAARLQWKNYFGAIADTLARHGVPLHGMAMDSHEAGSQNWTPGFEKQFMQRRGYSLIKYLPAMAGYVVGSVEESDGVLYDVRRTIADLIAENYYATFDSLCRERGMDFTAQATGNALCIVADPIQAKGRVSKPQGEFWAIHPDGNYDIKECSSAAHLYGKPIASGEAFTDVKFSQSLAYIKSLADYAYCYGLNEFVVCASAYQPWLQKQPGNTGGGRHYCLHRNNTYWPYSRNFWDYQSRCAYMMRQGRPVIDFAVYLGDNAPVKILTYRLPEIPSGHDFDAFTSDALLSRMQVENGKVVLPHGMQYRMIVLPRSGEITYVALQKIAALIYAGVPVYGVRPVGSPSHIDDAVQADYCELVDAVWGKKTELCGEHQYGKGCVYWGMSLSEAASRAGIVPDIALKHGDVKRDKLYFAHRQVADADIYFLDNHTDSLLADTITFRTKYKQAQLWNPIDGSRRILPVDDSDNVTIPLRMMPREAFFVILSADRDNSLSCVSWPGEGREESVQGAWQVSFDPKMGGPGDVSFSALIDWSQHPDTTIRYYSGTAVYACTLPIQSTPDEQVFLQFTNLRDVARVYLNGREVGDVWCSPWEIEITDYIRAGNNDLRIEVTNSLINRMVGDAFLPQNERYTYSYPPIVTCDDSLVPSGIIGKVLIEYRVQ